MGQIFQNQLYYVNMLLGHLLTLFRTHWGWGREEGMQKMFTDFFLCDGFLLRPEDSDPLINIFSKFYL